MTDREPLSYLWSQLTSAGAIGGGLDRDRRALDRGRGREPVRGDVGNAPLIATIMSWSRRPRCGGSVRLGPLLRQRFGDSCPSNIPFWLSGPWPGPEARHTLWPMPVCSSCGQANPDRFKFCGMCASPLVAATSEEVRKTVTLVFSDVAGSTALGEGRDPEAIRHVMKVYFAEMRRVIELHGGVVEKFVGDAVMAAFGIPVVREDDALRAVWAAADMRNSLRELNERFQQEWGIRMDVRIGVNTGEVIAGDSSARQTFATGDAVNTAARLEQSAPPGEILLGPSTYELVEREVSVEPVPALTLKGKSEPLPAWRLIEARPPPRAGRARHRLVDRARELNALTASLERVRSSGRPEMVNVVGEAGIGKTRLLEEFALGAERTSRILRGQCSPYGDTTAFQTIAEVLTEAVGPLAPTDLEAALNAARELLPDEEEAEPIARHIAALLGLTPAAGPVEETFWAVRRLLESLAATSPVVVMVDDVHRADDATLDILAHLGQDSRAELLVVSSSRPELLERRPSWPGRQLRSTRLDLDSLSEAESHALLAELADQIPLELASRIVEIAGGNPLFLEEIVSMLRDHLILGPGGQMAQRVDPETLSIPRTISALVEARIEALEPVAADFIGRASVIGMVVAREPLGVLAPPNVTGLSSVVDLLVAKGFFDRLAKGDTLMFRHGVVRETAYRRLPKKVRSDLHEALAGWMEATGEAPPGELGFHLEQAYRYRAELGMADQRTLDLAFRAASLLTVACREAVNRGDHRTGTGLMARAAALMRPQPVTEETTDIVTRLGKLAVTLADWNGAVELLARFASSGNRAVQRDLGVAMCKLHRSDPLGSEYRQGQTYLEMATRPPSRDPDAMASLAGTWRGIDEERARELYRRALDLDPSDPYALGNHLEYEIHASGGLKPLQKLRGTISAAIARCRQQADAGENLPWAFYDMGKFALLLDEAYPSLAAYCKALEISPAEFMVDAALASLQRLSAARSSLPAFEWVQRLLIVGAAARFATASALDRLKRLAPRPISISRPLVAMLAGGTHDAVEADMQYYREVLLDGFDQLEGIVLSGGTAKGVSRLAGDVGESSQGRIATIGYLPATVSGRQNAEPDRRFAEIRYTTGSDFSPLEPLQAWMDLLASGASPSKVKLIGINGGNVSAFEYRLALAVKATVGIVRDSGREADALLHDRDWITVPNLVALPADREAIRMFLQSDSERLQRGMPTTNAG